MSHNLLKAWEATMSDADKYITKDGFEKLEARVSELVAKRPELLELVKNARDIGGDDNTDLASAIKVVEELDELVANLNSIIYKSEIKQSVQPDIVGFGDVVSIESEMNGPQIYKIIGTNEISFWDNGVSVCSPVGEAIIGRKVGDEVDISVPNGDDVFLIKSIEQSIYED